MIYWYSVLLIVCTDRQIHAANEGETAEFEFTWWQRTA